MTIKTLGLTALAATLVIGFAGSADAATKRAKKPMMRQSGEIGMIHVSPGDSRAAINRAFPADANPPSLRQQYDLRALKQQDNRR